MSKTNWQDPGSSEILSTHISGLQEAVGKIEDAIGLQTVAETDVPLTEVYISDTDRYRIYQAPVGKRNWVASPAPVIKKNGVQITSGFTIDYGGGAIILSPAASSSDTFTADVTRVNSSHSITPASIGAETPAGAQSKVDAHAVLTTAHSATSAATANRIMMRDASGRAKVAAPAAADDIARKDTVDNHAIQTATLSTLGHVKVDGETILVDVNGKISTPVKTRLYQGRLQYWDTVSELWRDAGMIASEPHVADFRQQAAKVDTWYTVVNVSGAGVVYRISGCALSARNNVLQYQVVIDGVEHIFDMQADSSQKTRGLGGDPSLDLGREYFSDILLHVKFDESLQVNIRHNSGTTVTLQCSVDFGLV